MGSLINLPNFQPSPSVYTHADFNAAFANLLIGPGAVGTNELANAAVTLDKLAGSGFFGLSNKGFYAPVANGSSQLVLGQDIAHGVSLLWNYHVNPAAAMAVLATLQKNNPLTIQAKELRVDSESLDFALRIVSSGRVIVGGGADDGASALQTSTFRAAGAARFDSSVRFAGFSSGLLKTDGSGNIVAEANNISLVGANPRANVNHTSGANAFCSIGADSGVAWVGTTNDADFYLARNNTQYLRLFSSYTEVAGELRVGSLRLNATPTASTATTTHKLPINLNGTTYYLLLSNV